MDLSLQVVDPFISICESLPCAHERLDCLGEQIPLKTLSSALRLAGAFQFNTSFTTFSGLLQGSASHTEDVITLSRTQLLRPRAATAPLGFAQRLHRSSEFLAHSTSLLSLTFLLRGC